MGESKEATKKSKTNANLLASDSDSERRSCIFQLYLFITRIKLQRKNSPNFSTMHPHLPHLVIFLSLVFSRSGSSLKTVESREVLQKLYDLLETRVAEAEEKEEEQGFGEVGAVERRQMESPMKRVSFDPPAMAPSKLNQKQIKEILRLHSQERLATKGVDEMFMTWDDDLARLAQGLANSCHWGHANMKLPNGKKVGQNLAYWSNPEASVQSLVQLWIDEKHDYSIPSGVCAGGKVCGHYTQMVWRETTKVGCGLKKCPGMGAYIVCDYAKPGNWVGEKAVHLGGSACSKCNLYPGTACIEGQCSVCDPKADKNCKAYDGSTCKDAMKSLQSCSWVGEYCPQPKYRKWLEENCAKTCGFCHA